MLNVNCVLYTCTLVHFEIKYVPIRPQKAKGKVLYIAVYKNNHLRFSETLTKSCTDRAELKNFTVPGTCF